MQQTHVDGESIMKNGKPCCPNHGEPLEGCGFPLPQKGTGVCPVSGAVFSFEVDVESTETKRDKFGNMVKVKKFKISGEENQ